MDQFLELLRRLNLDLPGLTTLLKRTSDAPILRSVPVTIVVPTGQTTASAPHSLGKAFVGALVVTASTPLAYAVAPATDASTVRLTVASAPAAPAIFNLMVF